MVFETLSLSIYIYLVVMLHIYLPLSLHYIYIYSIYIYIYIYLVRDFVCVRTIICLWPRAPELIMWRRQPCAPQKLSLKVGLVAVMLVFGGGSSFPQINVVAQ